MKIFKPILVLLMITLLLWSFYQKHHANDSFVLKGATMGTSYIVSVYGKSTIGKEVLQKQIDSRLAQINQSMSTWLKDSELSKINKSEHEQWLPLSNDIYRVISEAIKISKATNGLFDITAGPLVNLWGFGPHGKDTKPSKDDIQKALTHSGSQHLELKDSKLRKNTSNMYLDLSSIAKGFAVDEIGFLLEKQGFSNYLVEIGGEVRARGLSEKNKAWTIGIEVPQKSISKNKVLPTTLKLSKGALATSGSYHNYIDFKDIDAHHIIDPRTGLPANSKLVSATVYAPNCMQADAIATALMIMGEEKALTWIEAHKEYEALLIIKEGNGDFRLLLSSDFSKLFS